MLVSSNLQRFPITMGESTEDLAPDEEETTTEPTEGNISAASHGEDTSHITSCPILTVLSRDTGFCDVMQHESGRWTHQRVKLTHLTLVDEDDTQVHARMATNIADRLRSLGEGDTI